MGIQTSNVDEIITNVMEVDSIMNWLRTHDSVKITADMFKYPTIPFNQVTFHIQSDYTYLTNINNYQTDHIGNATIEKISKGLFKEQGIKSFNETQLEKLKSDSFSGIKDMHEMLSRKTLNNMSKSEFATILKGTYRKSFRDTLIYFNVCENEPSDSTFRIYKYNIYTEARELVAEYRLGEILDIMYEGPTESTNSETTLYCLYFMGVIRYISLTEGFSKTKKIKYRKPLELTNKENKSISHKKKKNTVTIKKTIYTIVPPDKLPEEKYSLSSLGTYERHTGSWGVRGHWRHYKNGNKTWVKPHIRGQGIYESKIYKLDIPIIKTAN